MNELSTRKRLRSRITKQFKGMDQFGHPLNFNVGGEETIKTWGGLVFTLIAWAAIAMFVVIKGYQIAIRKNPMIFVTEEIDAFPEKFSIDIKESGFHFAFGVRDYSDRTTFKFDPAYVKPVATYIEKDDTGKTTPIDLKIHPCTSEDFTNGNFFKPKK